VLQEDQDLLREARMDIEGRYELRLEKEVLVRG
jgi:hypothetical protein